LLLGRIYNRRKKGHGGAREQVTKNVTCPKTHQQIAPSCAALEKKNPAAHDDRVHIPMNVKTGCYFSNRVYLGQKVDKKCARIGAVVVLGCLYKVAPPSPSKYSLVPWYNA